MSGGGEPDSLDDLIEFASHLGASSPPKEVRRPRWPIYAGGAALVAVAVLITAIVLRSGDDARTTSEPLPTIVFSGQATTADGVLVGPLSTTAQTSSPPATAPASGSPTGSATVAATVPSPGVAGAAVTTAGAPGASSAAGSTTVPGSTTPGTATTSATATTSGAGPSAIPLNAPVRWAEYSDGKVYLRGKVPSQTIADEIRAKAAAVVGDANVVVEYQIVPGTPLPKTAPLYVRDAILFPEGGDVLNAAARSVLDLGVVLFKQNPQMTVVVSGFTDSTGSADGNLKLSQRRVDVIVKYFTSRGVSPSHVSGLAKGEADPVADNSTAEGRAQNRRVELEVTNLLG